MTELDYGPNGGLVYCIEFLLQQLDWLHDELGEAEDDYWLIDCPGQIELYTAHPVMQKLLSHLQREYDFRICGVYMIEAQFLEDPAKFFAGILAAMSAMIQLEIPYFNVLSKVDMIESDMEDYEFERYSQMTKKAEAVYS